MAVSLPQVYTKEFFTFVKTVEKPVEPVTVFVQKVSRPGSRRGGRVSAVGVWGWLDLGHGLNAFHVRLTLAAAEQTLCMAHDTPVTIRLSPAEPLVHPQVPPLGQPRPAGHGVPRVLEGPRVTHASVQYIAWRACVGGVRW